MPHNLKRYQESGQAHFITFSCYGRLPYLADDRLKQLLLASLESTRRRYLFLVYGYVVMPEHVHLLLSEPPLELLSRAIQSLKVSFVRRRDALSGAGFGTFWQKRYYDHNVRSAEDFRIKLRYIHRNPVKRGLCAGPMDWSWSSFRHYATAEAGLIELESQWIADRRAGESPKLMA